MGPNTLEDFFVRFDVDVESGCWVWNSYGFRDGYGGFWLQGKKHHAHRLGYEVMVGPVPEGLQLDHLCRNRRCVNPDHLEPVTQYENFMRGQSFVALQAQSDHCKRGHEFSPTNTYVRREGGRRCRICQRAAQSRFRQSRIVV